MTMFKTREQIESEADFLYGEDAKNGDSWKYHTYIAVYSQAQQDIKEACSEGFKEWVYKYPDKCDLRDFKNPNHNYFVAEEAWQACALSKMKELQKKDIEIEKLKKKISSFDAYASADEKYQEAVKDIQKLLDIRDRLRSKLVSMRAFEIVDSVFNPIRIKYGIDKKEG